MAQERCQRGVLIASSGAVQVRQEHSIKVTCKKKYLLKIINYIHIAFDILYLRWLVAGMTAWCS